MGPTLLGLRTLLQAGPVTQDIETGRSGNHSAFARRRRRRLLNLPPLLFPRRTSFAIAIVTPFAPALWPPSSSLLPAHALLAASSPPRASPAPIFHAFCAHDFSLDDGGPALVGFLEAPCDLDAVRKRTGAFEIARIFEN